MSIINIQTVQTGLVGVLPSLAYIDTNSTEAAVLTTGFLNKEVANGVQFSLPCIAAVNTQETPTSAKRVGWYQVSHSGANWSLIPTGSPGDVTLPTIANHIATYTNTTGTLSEDAATAINGGNIQAGLSGTAGYFASFPSAASKGSLRLTAVANTGDTLVTISNALHGQATVYSIPDSGASTANFILSKTTGTQHITVGGLQVDAGIVTSGISTGGQVGSFAAFPTTASKGSLRLTALVNATGDFYTEISNALAVAQSQVISIPDSGSSTANFLLSKLTGAGIQHITSGSLEVDAGNLIAGIGTGGTAGNLILYPATATNGSLRLVPVGNVGNFNTTISDITGLGQTQVVTVPDSGAATAKFLLDTGTGATATITKISTGATPVPLVDPGSCTITAAAGASNTATVTIQLKDGSGTNIARSVAFRVYSSSSADGLTLQSAASTGYSVASGGLSLANGTAVTTQITAMSSATGGCVLSLLDTGKQTSYLVLVLPSGNKISAQLSAGSYGA
jgi:hypothetical protein